MRMETSRAGGASATRTGGQPGATTMYHHVLAFDFDGIRPRIWGIGGICMAAPCRTWLRVSAGSRIGQAMHGVCGGMSKETTASACTHARWYMVYVLERFLSRRACVRFSRAKNQSAFISVGEGEGKVDGVRQIGMHNVVELWSSSGERGKRSSAN
jgi:hypothetical protein